MATRHYKYERSEETSITRGRARDLFLMVLREVAPTVLQALDEMEVEAWAKLYNLDSADWVIKHARRAKRAWKSTPTLRAEYNWASLRNVPAHWGWTPDRLELSVTGWAPLRETPAEFKRRATAELVKLLDLHVAETTRQGNFKQVHPHPQLERDLRWLVRFQVLGDTYAGIAESEAVAPQLVRSAVLEAAELIGLPLREAKRGRPKGSTTRKPLHP